MANKSFVMEKGVSDFHQMTHCIPSHLPKLGPTIIKYKDHMSSWNGKFQSQINKGCEKFYNALELGCYLNICKAAFKETVLQKQKFTRGGIAFLLIKLFSRLLWNEPINQTKI